MTDAMKRILLPLAVLLVAAGCNHFKVETYQDNLEMAAGESPEDSLLFSINVDYVAGGLSQKAMENINRSIVAHAFDLETPETSLEESAILYRDNLVDEYLTDYEAGEEGFYFWEDDIQGEFLPDWKGWKNYLLQYYCFRGGAHGIDTESYLVFEAKTGRQIQEADLFKDGFEEPVADMLRAAVEDSFPYEEELSDMLRLENVVPNGNFFMDKDGITWAYQPYEAGPYALGIVTATLSWEDLKPYLK